MTEKRLALIIASYEYQDPDLQQLVAPTQDAEALGRVLDDAAIGDFEVKILPNLPSHEVCFEIASFFVGRQRDDLILLYFSGHGVKDDDGRLYLATTNTRRGLLRATAVPATFVNETMTASRSRRQVLILDCCHSGAFAEGMVAKGGESVGIRDRFEGRGRVVLTASTSTEYAFQGDEIIGEGSRSVFTRHLVRGLETGEADLDGDGWVSLDELYDYVHDRVTDETPKQTPSKWVFDVRGNILIARNPKFTGLLELPWATQEQELTTIEYNRAHLLAKAASLAGEMDETPSKTTSVLAQAIVGEGVEYLANGLSPLLLKRGLEKATSVVSAFIEETATQTITKDEIISAAYTLVQEPKIGDLIAGIVSKADNHIPILVQDGERSSTEVEYTNGFRFLQGCISHYFITDPDAKEAVIEEPHILITDYKISAVADITPLLEELVTDHKRDLVLIAEDVDGEALSTLVLNKLRGRLNVSAVKAPGYGYHRDAMLQDMAILTGATVISKRTGREVSQTKVSELGRAERVVATKQDTLIVGGAGDASRIAVRIEQVRAAMEQSGDKDEIERLRERLSLLCSEVAVIRVGADTDARREMVKQQLREAVAGLDLFLKQLSPGAREGIVPGAGVALLNGASALDNFHPNTGYEEIGVDILCAALEAPARKILAGAGLDGAEGIENIRRLAEETGNRNIGYDIFSESFVDLVEVGVIESARTVCQALENAVEISTRVLIEEFPSSSESSDILKQTIVRKGTEHLMVGYNPKLLERGLRRTMSIVSGSIRKATIPLKSKEDIHRISNSIILNHELAETAAGLVDKVGRYGSILVEDGEGTSTEIEYVNGFRFPQGYISPYFITHPDALEAVIEEPHILITDHKISAVADITPLLEELVTDHKRDLVLIAEDVDGEALSTLVLNKMRGVLNVLGVKAPGYGDHRDAMLQDMAILSGATMISKRTGCEVSQTKVSELGRAERVVATKQDTLIVGGAGDASRIAVRIEQVRAAMEQSGDEDEIERLRERLSLLCSEVAMIRVGADTDARREKRRRQVSDAIAVMRAAVAEGIVPGGGVPLLIGIAGLDDFHTELRYERIGVDILRAGLQACLRKMTALTGLDSEEIIENVRSLVQETGNRNIGLNVFDGEYVDMLEAGVIEPTQIVLRSLEDAFQSALAALFGPSNSVGSESTSI